MKTNDEKMKGNYRICSSEIEQKRYMPWSPLEKNKFVTRHTYVSCSRSVPRRNKHFVRYNMSRSLNYDRNVCGSSLENGSLEEDKHMFRSSKIMKALNFHTSLSHYGKTKIKKSLNFNSTPSPKRFPSTKKRAQVASSLNFSSPLSVSNKFPDSFKDQNDSTSSSYDFSLSDSIDENQNETEGEMLHYSTPNAKLNTKSVRLANFTPLLRSRLEDNIADIVDVNGMTPDLQPLKSIKVSSKRFDNSMTNTSRNLFHEFHEDEVDRPQTPENVITIVPESMSAIKRSHKKERSSRRSGHCVTQVANGFPDSCAIEDTTKLVLTCEKNEGKPRLGRLSLDNSEADNISDTGSLFDYAEESTRLANRDSVSLTKFQGIVVKGTTSQEIVENNSDIEDRHGVEELRMDSVEANDLSSNDVCTEVEDRSVTPELTTDVVLEPQTSVTPENRIHYLRRVAEDSIKKSHKKNKETNKTKLFGVKILQSKVETAKEENENDRESVTDQNESIAENKLVDEEENRPDLAERACTPEKVHSSRLLLPQFSSVKKSHKKDKHASILSGFLKRQEHFNKEMGSARDSKNLGSDVDVGFDVDVDVGPASKHTANMETYSCLGIEAHEAANLADSSSSLNVPSDKLSPSKRKIPLDDSLGDDTSVSCNSELYDSDSSQRGFQIFTPLKRKRSLIVSNAKDYAHFYDLPPGKDEYSEEDLANVNLLRCLTPVLSTREHCKHSSGHRLAATTSDNESETFEVQNDSDQDHDYDSNDRSGRSTPRNMSTTELYSNLDSIKKSHKKNKRGNNSRKLGFNPIEDDACENRGWQSLSTEIGNDSLEKFELSRSEYDGNQLAIDLVSSEDDNVQGPSRVPASEQTSNTSNANPNADIVVQNVTPPNCLKTKTYIRLLRETSIKRSHKKVRDQKKYEATVVEPNHLSDDGSIFGDEEKSLDTECRSVLK